MKESRRKQIESLLAERRSISMHELCEALNVSMNTVRADVSSLVREGIVEKVYGGIVLKQPEEIPLYERRSQQGTDCWLFLFFQGIDYDNFRFYDII